MTHNLEKKKLVFIIDVLGVGGAERLMVPIIANLLGDYEIRVCVFRIKDGNPIASQILSMGIPVDYLPIYHLRDITAIPRLVRYLQKHKPHIVHTQLEFADILGNLACKFLKIPSITTIHIIPPSVQKIKQRMHQKLWWNTLKYLCQRIITVSEMSQTHTIRHYGIRPEKVTTIYNGIDISPHYSKFQVKHASVKNQLNIPENAHVLLTVAILRKQKGVQFMVRAIPDILLDYPNVYYLIVGNGPHLENLEREVRELNITDKVIFTGMREDIPEILSISDIFVLPTLTEALPTVLAEAMAAKLPIVASAVGGVPEMVQDGINGILTAPGDPSLLSKACIKLLGSKGLREEMGIKGYELTTKKFNIHIQINQLNSIYNELIANYE